MEDFSAQLLDIISDAVIDTLYLIPFLFITYLAMEWLEHRASDQFQKAIQRGGVAGPIIGSFLGVIPQCGFSAAASTLYAARVITLGTLFAVYLSTSDEMLPIFIAEQVPLSTIAPILAVKVGTGMVFGFMVDAVLRRSRAKHTPQRIHELCERDGCRCGEKFAESSTCRFPILRSAISHTLRITLFVFLILFLLNMVLALVGEDALAEFMNANSIAAIFATGLVGLIPNCAASVAIAQLYVDGLLGAGAMITGLLAATGVGLIVLLRTNKHVGENLAIIASLYGISVVVGLVINACGIVF